MPLSFCRAHPEPVEKQVDEEGYDGGVEGGADVEGDDNIIPVVLEPLHGQFDIVDAVTSEYEITGDILEIP